MKKIVYFILMIVFSCLLFFNVKALSYGGCEYSEIAKLKSFVSNINITYDYYIEGNTAYFDITINNLIPGIYFVDSVSDKKYTYNDSIDGELIIRGNSQTNGHYKFFSAKQECYGLKLSNKYYNLPSYNIYYNEPLCKQNPNFSLCQKWMKVNFSYSELNQKFQEYNLSKNKINDNNISVFYKKSILDKIIEFYIKYYYIIFISIIVICIIAMTISRRKNRFDL